MLDVSLEAQLHDERGVLGVCVVAGDLGCNAESSGLVECDHRFVPATSCGDDAGAAVVFGKRDLPSLHEAAEAEAVEFGENSGGGDVERARLEGSVVVVAAIESGATDGEAVEEQPIGFALLPIGGREPVGFGEDFMIEGDQAAEVGGEVGFAELDVHVGGSK